MPNHSPNAATQLESTSGHPRHIDTYLALASHAEVDSCRQWPWKSPELPTPLALWPETAIQQQPRPCRAAT
ncbi:hypothetical protein PSEUDO9AZ_11543 [Pseudomonas sp. 9AZ]|nr:hypothetical protein PSEUDO9AZ_11543 [Pseudomonas sp. 9AZ]